MAPTYTMRTIWRGWARTWPRSESGEGEANQPVPQAARDRPQAHGRPAGHSRHIEAGYGHGASRGLSGAAGGLQGHGGLRLRVPL